MAAVSKKDQTSTVTLWIESAYQSLKANAENSGDAIRTFQTEEQFFAIVASGARNVEGGAAALARQAAAALEEGRPLSAVTHDLLAQLPPGEHAPLAILHARHSTFNVQRSTFNVQLIECDAPPLFFVRRGQLVLLPVVEEEVGGRLVRQCEFTLQDGDHLAMVSEGYIRASGWNTLWGWRDVALSIKRLTDTRCDAEQLLGALVRSYHRLAGSATTDRRPPTADGNTQYAVRSTQHERDVSIIAMAVRPIRTVTVWSGPPVDRKVEKSVLEKLMAESGKRIICGDTTAEIAARLLGARIEMEPRPADGWAEVPPVSRLAGIDLVTEGVVTMGKARERMANVKRARDLPRKEDGATRLARLLLEADKIHFLVGLAINPAQTADQAGKVPMRQIVIEGLISDLQARGKLVSVERF